MKKLCCILLAAISVALSAHAVPSGTYQDERGNTVLVSDSQNIYILDNNGHIKYGSVAKVG